MRPLKIGTPISRHLEITSWRFMCCSSASSVGVRWTATNPSCVVCALLEFYRARATCQTNLPVFAAFRARGRRLDRVRHVDERVLEPEVLGDQLAEPADAER